MMIAWFLIIIGTIFLLENLNIIPELNWDIIWPIILILTGVFILKKKSGKSCCGWGTEKKEEKHQ